MSLLPIMLRFSFDGFSNLSSAPGECTSQQMTDGLGNAWELSLFPGGGIRNTARGSNVDDPCISVALLYAGTEAVIIAKATLIMRDSHGKVYREFKSGAGSGLILIWDSGANRSKILDEKNGVLVKGALLIDVHIQMKPETDSLHFPPNPFGMNMLKLLENEDDADVSFMVKTTRITAHELVLKTNAPVLYGFCEGYEKGQHIPIGDDTTPEIFHIILQYVYGGDPSDSVTADSGKALIVAADRYGIVGLKLKAETELVGAMVMNKTNVAEWLLFADSMNCPLLKEQATSFFVARAADLVDSKWSKELNESPRIMNELVKEISTRLANDPRFNDTGMSMTVNELRKNLHKKDLDVDGSKEMLISRLNESNNRQRTE